MSLIIIILINREIVEEDDIPEHLKDLVAEKREELIATLADVDDEIGDLFLNEETPTAEQLHVSNNQLFSTCKSLNNIWL